MGHPRKLVSAGPAHRTPTSPWRLVGSAVASGLLLNLSLPNAVFPETASWTGGFAWIMLVPWLTVFLRSPITVWQGVWSGGLLGVSMWLIHVRWTLAIPYLEWRAPFLWVGAALYAGSFIALAGGLLAWSLPRLSRDSRAASSPPIRWSVAVVLPTVWVAVEWFQQHLWEFPWNVGVALYLLPHLSQAASLGGALGLSFLVVLVNTLLAGSLVHPARRWMFGSAAVGIFLANATWGTWRLHRLESVELSPARKVAILQGAYPLEVRRDPKNTLLVLDGYERLAREAARSRPDLIIWPEAAAPGLLRFHPVAWPRVAALTKETGVPQVLGFDDALLDERGYPTHFFNTAWLLNSEGILTQVYQKRRLFPFGERIPWKRWGIGTRFFVGQQELTPGLHQTLFETPVGKAAMPICNEIQYADDVRRWVNEGADVIINLANDTWFEGTEEPAQHLGVTIMRALENGRYILRASDSGISTVISPTGRVLQSLPVTQRGFLVHPLTQPPAPTLFARLGFTWLIPLAFVSLWFLLKPRPRL